MAITPAVTEEVDMSRPVYTDHKGRDMFAVWAAGKVTRYVTRTEAATEHIVRAVHANPVAGTKPNKLSGAYLTAMARR